MKVQFVEKLTSKVLKEVDQPFVPNVGESVYLRHVPTLYAWPYESPIEAKHYKVMERNWIIGSQDLVQVFVHEHTN